MLKHPEKNGENWWNRKCGAREVLRIAIPLVISTMSYTVMQFCDRLFLAWHSTTDLAAVVPAGALSWTSVSLPLGIAMYSTTFVAQYQGAGRKDRISLAVWQSVWVALATVPLFLTLGWFGPELFQAVGHSEELIWREAAYFWILSFGSAANVANAGLGAFWTGRGDTRTVMYINMAAALANVLLDYALIFGVPLTAGLRIPEMGIAGAAVATSVSQWLASGVFLLLFLGRKNRSEYSTFHNCRLDRGLMSRLLRYGIPNGFQLFVEGGSITVFVLIIAHISNQASAATALAFSINMFVFIPVLGLSFAISTLVGQQIGESSPEMAVRATWTGLWIGMVYTVTFAALYVLVPDVFLALHQAGAADFDGVHELAVRLLKFVALFSIFDSIQIVFVSAIKGAGDTLFVVLFTIVSAVCFLAAGFGLTQLFDPQAGIWTWWGCLTGWIILLAAAYLWRFQQGKWKSMQVIEPGIV